MKREKSLRQQARELQISPSYLSMILSGQRQPSAMLKDKMCSLGVFTDKAKFFLEGRNSTTELLPRDQTYFTPNLTVGKQKDAFVFTGLAIMSWSRIHANEISFLTPQEDRKENRRDDCN